MDNEYTRKENECPLVIGFCNQDHKDCNICIAAEEAWQEEQCRIVKKGLPKLLEKAIATDVKEATP